MTIAAVAAVLVFVAFVGLGLALVFSGSGRRAIRERLAQPAQDDGLLTLMQEPERERRPLLGRYDLHGALETLIEQAGRKMSAGSILLLMAGQAVVGFLIAWLRTGSVLWAVVAAVVVGALPLGYLFYKRQERVKAFEEQFPEALDMMSRAVRAGYALSGGIQLVSEEMPEPVGEELKLVAEEIRLGVEPGEALAKLWRRMPTSDVGFFCTAIRIQRSAGGNLAEMLDRLSEVIRTRFAILGQARALSAQQRYAAIIVGVSPLAFAILMRLMNPRYFDPLLASPYGPKLIAAGFVMEAIGFALIWRIAKIKI